MRKGSPVRKKENKLAQNSKVSKYTRVVSELVTWVARGKEGARVGWGGEEGER